MSPHSPWRGELLKRSAEAALSEGIARLSGLAVVCPNTGNAARASAATGKAPITSLLEPERSDPTPYLVCFLRNSTVSGHACSVAFMLPGAFALPPC